MKALTVFLLYMPLISLVGHLSSFLLLLFNVQALSFLNTWLFRRCLDYNSTVLFVLWFSFCLAHHVQALLKWRPLCWGYLLWFQGVNPDLIVLRVISGAFLFIWMFPGCIRWYRFVLHSYVFATWISFVSYTYAYGQGQDLIISVCIAADPATWLLSFREKTINMNSDA